MTVSYKSNYYPDVGRFVRSASILTVASRLCVLSPKDTRPNQDSPGAGSALLLSKQQVAAIRREGHLNALNDSWIGKEKKIKMKRNIVSRDFVFRL